MTRKRNHRMRHTGANCLYLDNLIGNNLPPQEDEVLALMNDIRSAYQRVREGVGTREDLVRLGIVMNTGCIRGKEVGQPVVDAFQSAGEALMRAEDRMETHGRFGFDGPGTIAMNAAMDLYHELISMSGRKQMKQAEAEARRWMARAAA